MFPGCSCKSDRPIKDFFREQAPSTHGTVHSGGAHLGLAWSTEMYMQLLGTLWGLTYSRRWPVLDQPQAQLSRDPRSTQEATHVCILNDPASSPTGQQWLSVGLWQRLCLSPYSGSRGAHRSLYLNPAPDCTSLDHQTKA